MIYYSLNYKPYSLNLSNIFYKDKISLLKIVFLYSPLQLQSTMILHYEEYKIKLSGLFLRHLQNTVSSMRNLFLLPEDMNRLPFIAYLTPLYRNETGSFKDCRCDAIFNIMYFPI